VTAGVVRPQKPVRDRPTWISYIQISLFAFFLYGFGATQALLRDEQGTSRTLSGLHATSFAIAAVIAALLLPKAIHRWGRSKVLRYGVIGMCIGLGVYTWPGAGLPVSLSGVFIISGFGAAIIITSNAFFLDYQKGAGPATLTEGNAIAATFGFISPLVIGIGTATFLGWRTGLWALIVALIVSEILRGRYASAYGEPGLVRRREEHHGPLPFSYWATLVMVAFLLATEFSLTLWSADLLRDRGDLGAAAAAASVAAILGGMVTGRLIGGRLAETHSIDFLLRTSIGIALVAFVLVWWSTNAALIVVGLFLLGIGISVHWPMGVSRVVRASGGLTDTGSSAASLWGAAAGGVAPFILGALSDSYGVHAAFLIIPVMLVAAFVIITLVPVTGAEELPHS
jgi:predicted MFS family arabinose efflux permease